jgi:hypothetical protein
MYVVEGCEVKKLLLVSAIGCILVSIAVFLFIYDFKSTTQKNANSSSPDIELLEKHNKKMRDLFHELHKNPQCSPLDVRIVSVSHNRVKYFKVQTCRNITSYSPIQWEDDSEVLGKYSTALILYKKLKNEFNKRKLEDELKRSKWSEVKIK